MVRCADPARPWLALSDPEHVLLWNWETGQIEAIRDEERSILAMEFNRAGLLATASKDSCLRLWRVA
jgi:WD40 repeat protein